MTAEEFFDLRDGFAMQELVEGEVIDVTAAGCDSSYIAVRIVLRLGAHVEAHNMGRVLGADGGYIIGRDPDTVRVPDVSFVGKARLAETADLGRLIAGAPDLAVEVLSPTDRGPDSERKCLEYLAAGTKLVWLVFPELRRIHVYRSAKEIEVLTDEDTLTAEPVVPGFSCPVAEVFGPEDDD